MRLFASWKLAVARASGDLLRFGCAFVVVDVAAGLSGCFLPAVSGLLGLARVALLAILVGAVLRVLAMRHADRPDAQLLSAIAVAVGVGAVYVVARTFLVVEICAM